MRVLFSIFNDELIDKTLDIVNQNPNIDFNRDKLDMAPTNYYLTVRPIFKEVKFAVISNKVLPSPKDIKNIEKVLPNVEHIIIFISEPESIVEELSEYCSEGFFNKIKLFGYESDKKELHKYYSYLEEIYPPADTSYKEEPIDQYPPSERDFEKASSKFIAAGIEIEARGDDQSHVDNNANISDTEEKKDDEFKEQESNFDSDKGHQTPYTEKKDSTNQVEDQKKDMENREEETLLDQKTFETEAEKPSSLPLKINNDEPELTAKTYTNAVIRDKNAKLEIAFDIPVYKTKKIKKEKVIGVWSPLKNIGCTSFSINFATCLATLNIPVAVIEGLQPQPALLPHLSRFEGEPEHWTSYAEYLFSKEDIDAKRVIWATHDVNYFPLHANDLKRTWEPQMLKYLIEGLRIHDVTLVDLPTGHMENHTKVSLKHVDELWIIVNDQTQILNEWKPFISQVKAIVPETKLIFSPLYSFSKTETISSFLDIPILTEIPDLTADHMKNFYESKPLYLMHHDKPKRILNQSFEPIIEHLLKDHIALCNQKKRSLKDRIISVFS
ncbi:hypothetical protein AB3N04_01110 (plasmid) [Alkalihalophilus sp. As8PL]|uniref:Uncharacterized protein n=1 Tax=Alkalihalophilus sp. As8PL TaxID=3237103 RepID=A0AB39BMI2_9BACI